MIHDAPHRPIRVLHVVKSLGLGGTEKAMQLMASHLDRDRFEPIVFSFAAGERGPLLRAAGVVAAPSAATSSAARGSAVRHR